MLWNPFAVPLPVTRRSAPVGPGLLAALARLGQVVAELDATDPDTDSNGYDQAIDAVTDTARHTVRAAMPVLERAGLLAEVFQAAIEDLEDLPEWCGPCEVSDHGLCMDHAADQATARRYLALLTALTGSPAVLPLVRPYPVDGTKPGG